MKLKKIKKKKKKKTPSGIFLHSSFKNPGYLYYTVFTLSAFFCFEMHSLPESSGLPFSGSIILNSWDKTSK